MATDIYTFDVTIPAGTSDSAPLTVDIGFDSADVEQIDIRVPPGPSGLMGFQLWVKGAQVIPRQLGKYIVTDNADISWKLENLPDTGSWQVVGYNNDIYDHTIEINMAITPIGAVTAATAAEASNSVTADVLNIAGG